MVSVSMTVGEATNAPTLMTTWTNVSFDTESSGSVALTLYHGTAPHSANATAVKTTLTITRLLMIAATQRLWW